MTWFKILAAFVTALELITDQVKKYVERKEKIDAQNRYDDIDRDPAGYFMRKFRDKNKTTDSNSKPGERNGTT